MLTREEIIKLLREKQPFLAAEFGVSRIGLFGSFAAGQPDATSDVDLLVEFDRPIGFRFIELAEYLENLLGRRVDLLTPLASKAFAWSASRIESPKGLSMSKQSDREFLSDIREAIQRITSYTIGMSYDDFLSDAKTQDAVIHNLEILGEAAKNLSEEFRAAHAPLPWRSMMGTRDRLIHHYFGVSLDIVWQIVSLELPEVGSQLQKLAEDEGSSSQTP